MMELKINGEVIDVRELSIDQWRALEVETRPLLEALHVFFIKAQAEEHEFSNLEIRAAAFGAGEFGQILAAHTEILGQLMAQACGRDLAWVRGNRLDDGVRLLIAFLAINADRIGRFAAHAHPRGDFH
jgi:hypothetical protein